MRLRRRAAHSGIPLHVAAQAAPVILTIKLEGHLTETSLRAAFRGAESPALGRYGMLVNCFELQSYELASREAFVEWHKRERARIAGVAILTTRAVWHMVIGAMAVASGQAMRAFDKEREARAWLTRRLA